MGRTRKNEKRRKGHPLQRNESYPTRCVHHDRKRMFFFGIHAASVSVPAPPPSAFPPKTPYICTYRQIRVFSFETGLEVMLQGGRRLSTNTRGDADAARGGNATPAAIAAAATAPVVAAEVASDNGTLAVACAGSGDATDGCGCGYPGGV